MKFTARFTNLVSLLAFAFVAVAGFASAQGADPSTRVDITGTVLAFTGGSGSGMPMLTVDDANLGSVDVALGPAWFLQAAEFSAAPGDEVDISAFACAVCAAPYVAQWVENLTTGAFVDLRDENARPLWTHRQYQRAGSGRPGQGNGNGGSTGGGGEGGGTGGPGGSGNGSGSGPANGSGLDMSQIATITGVIVDFTGHAGSGQPVLTLEVGREVLEIVISPYAPVQAAGLVFETGIEMTVTFAPTDCDENPQNISIAIIDPATGLTIQLRDPETGFPMTNGNGHHQPNWP